MMCTLKQSDFERHPHVLSYTTNDAVEAWNEEEEINMFICGTFIHMDIVLAEF